MSNQNQIKNSVLHLDSTLILSLSQSGIEIVDSNVYVYPDVNIEMLKDLKLTRTVVMPIKFFIQNKELKDKLEEANYEILRLKSKLVVGGTKEIPKLSYSEFVAAMDSLKEKVVPEEFLQILHGYDDRC